LARSKVSASETARQPVGYEGLAILSPLKIQSTPAREGAHLLLNFVEKGCGDDDFRRKCLIEFGIKGIKLARTLL